MLFLRNLGQTIGMLSLFILFSCEKDSHSSELTITESSNSQVTTDFDFSMHQSVEFITQSWEDHTELELIDIFNLTGIKIGQLSMKNTNLEINLPKTKSSVQIVYRYRDGSDFTELLPIEHKSVFIDTEDITTRATEISTSTTQSAFKSSSSPVCHTCNTILNNASGETPFISSGFKVLSESAVPYWHHTDGEVEIHVSGTQGVPSHHGRQFIEINASTDDGTLYREACLVPGSTIGYSIWHRGRRGVDAAIIKIGGSLATAAAKDTMITDNTNWVEYTGTYTVPAGETTTIFAFEALFSAPGVNDYREGNFVDHFQLTCISNDSDLDGVSDENDEFPNDSLRSGIVFSDTSTLAVEDLWPYKGDYDFNDLVAPYSYKAITNASSEIVDLVIYYEIKARGGASQIGLGFSLPANPAKVASTTGQYLNSGYLNTAINGTESGTNSSELHLFVEDNVARQIDGWNTFANHSIYPSNVDSINILFNEPINTSILANLNPFVVINQDRGKEIRTIDQLPSSLVNNELFGTGDDDSNPISNQYFRTVDGLPWMLNIPGNFNWTTENTNIEDGYLNFRNWYVSKGEVYQSWHDDSNPENVNQGRLFN